MSPRLIYSVAPRFTGGSPAGVDEATARRVAQQERDACQRALEGMYGEEKQALAEQAGRLRGIVLIMSSRGGLWDVEDALTGERYQESTLARVPVGSSGWLYTGHMHEDLARPAMRRHAERLVQHADGRYEDVRDPKRTAVMVAAPPAPTNWYDAAKWAAR